MSAVHFKTETDEPATSEITLRLVDGENRGEVHVKGSTSNNGEWFIGSFMPDGTFRRSASCALDGLSTDGAGRIIISD